MVSFPLEVLKRRLSSKAYVHQPSSVLQPAAVLVPLYQVGEEVFLLLTRRTDRVEHHKGQISFPGGAAEPGEDLMQTALRETQEEIGIPPEEVEVLGVLGNVEVAVSGFVVTPFVGVIPHPYPIRLNADEIAELVLIPLSVFQNPTNLRIEQRDRGGMLIEVYFYDHGKHTVWGATARIVKQLVDLVAGPDRLDKTQ